MIPFDVITCPLDWAEYRLGDVLKRSKRDGAPDLPMLSVNLPDGVVVRGVGLDDRSAPSEDRGAYLVVEPGALVMNPLGKPHGSLGVSEHVGIVSPAYFVAQITRDVYPRFLHYLLRTRLYISEYERRGKWMPPSQFNISWDELKSIRVVIPPLELQHCIGDFLDAECARIRRLNHELEGLSATLHHQERDHFGRIVGPNASVMPLRYLLTSFDQGWSPECEAREADEGEWGVLKVGCVNRNQFRPMEHKRLPDGLEPRLRAEISVGELLMSRANTRELVGSAAVVTTTERRRLMLSDKLYRLRLNARALPRYVALALRDQGARDQIEIATAGASSSMQNISQDVVRGLRIPVVTLEDQRRVVATMDAHQHRLAQTQDEVVRLMQNLIHYRDALITEAATGQLDVRKLADAQMDEGARAAIEGKRPEVLSG